MPRSYTYSALTLRIRSSGESNREAWFLTAEEGIIKATVFGGPKSRLRAQVAPFHEGKLWIYHDPVRDSRKVNDFDVLYYRTGIRELLERVMAADAVAETVLASHGGGGAWSNALRLSGAVLDALDSSDAALCSRIAVYFMWHWAEVLGARPELSACGACACEPGRDEVLWYLTGKDALLCERCRGIYNGSFQVSGGGSYLSAAPSSPWVKLGPGARHWLNGIDSLVPPALARVTLDSPSMEQARVFVQAVLAGAFGRKLSTWEEI